MVTLIADLQLSHRFSYVKFTLLLVFILNYQIQHRTPTFRLYFERDLCFCGDCFQHQALDCQIFFDKIEHDYISSPWQSIVNLLPSNGKRETSFLRYRNNTKSPRIIAKYLTQQKLNSVAKLSNITSLREKFLYPERLHGLQYCPSKNIDRFINNFKRHTKYSEVTIWLQMVLNVEPLLMPHLEKEGFPVPMHFTACGFTLYQAYAGRALIYFYDADFKLKLHIAQQLLEAAIKFSNGLEGFRIYITDLSPDNVVFNEITHKLSFVDLDTVLIVDSEALHRKNTLIHKHNYIECENCFAYSQQDICDYKLSDINLFSACQLLRENLNRDRQGGFLYPIPLHVLKTYPNFERILQNCVDCNEVECTNRFAATLELIELFNAILKDSY